MDVICRIANPLNFPNSLERFGHLKSVVARISALALAVFFAAVPPVFASVAAYQGIFTLSTASFAWLTGACALGLYLGSVVLQGAAHALPLAGFVDLSRPPSGRLYLEIAQGSALTRDSGPYGLSWQLRRDLTGRQNLLFRGVPVPYQNLGDTEPRDTRDWDEYFPEAIKSVLTAAQRRHLAVLLTQGGSGAEIVHELEQVENRGHKNTRFFVSLEQTVRESIAENEEEELIFTLLQIYRVRDSVCSEAVEKRLQTTFQVNLTHLSKCVQFTSVKLESD